MLPLQTVLSFPLLTYFVVKTIIHIVSRLRGLPLPPLQPLPKVEMLAVGASDEVATCVAAGNKINAIKGPTGKPSKSIARRWD